MPLIPQFSQLKSSSIHFYRIVQKNWNEKMNFVTGIVFKRRASYRVGALLFFRQFMIFYWFLNGKKSFLSFGILPELLQLFPTSPHTAVI